MNYQCHSDNTAAATTTLFWLLSYVIWEQLSASGLHLLDKLSFSSYWVAQARDWAGFHLFQRSPLLYSQSISLGYTKVGKNWSLRSTSGDMWEPSTLSANLSTFIFCPVSSTLQEGGACGNSHLPAIFQNSQPCLTLRLEDISRG